MPYNAAFAPDALARFDLLAPTLAWKIYEAVDRLCQNPTELSTRSYFPHPPHLQIFETYLEHDGERRLLKVFFRFAQDEQTLLIDDFVLVKLG